MFSLLFWINSEEGGIAFPLEKESWIEARAMYPQTLHIFLTFAHFFLCCGQGSIFRIVGKEQHESQTYTMHRWDLDGWERLASKGKAFTFFPSVCWIYWQHACRVLGWWRAMIWTYHFAFHLFSSTFNSTCAYITHPLLVFKSESWLSRLTQVPVMLLLKILPRS